MANIRSYVVNSINLGIRIRNYDVSFLKSKQNIYMAIVKALLKYKHDGFSLWIFKYGMLSNISTR